EATAWSVKLLSHQRRESPLLPKATLWLMNHRDSGYWWNSTKQTAMVIYGLIDYLKATNELNPNLTATVLVNGRPVLTRRIEQSTSLTPPDLVLNESQLEQGTNHVQISAAGQGRLYYSLRGEYHSSEPQLQNAGSTSLNVLRDYFRLTPGRS